MANQTLEKLTSLIYADVAQDKLLSQYLPRLKDLIMDDMRTSGYQIPGELPKYRPPAYREAIYEPGKPPRLAPPEPTMRALEPEEAIPLEKEGMIPPEAREYEPERTYFQQLKDLAWATAKGKINPAEFIWEDALSGLTFGTIDPIKAIEFVSGKKGLREKLGRYREEIAKKEIGYVPEKPLKTLAGIAATATSLVPLALISTGVSVPAAAASKIDALKSAARALGMGLLTGMLSKPEDDTVYNRLKQVPTHVAMWGVWEAGFLTASKALQIMRWNKQFKGYIPGARIEPITGEIKERMVAQFNASQMQELFRKMDANIAAASAGKAPVHTLTDVEKEVIDLMKEAPGWKEAIRQGFFKEIKVTTRTIQGWKVSPERIPKKPEWLDIFRQRPKFPEYEPLAEYQKRFPEEVWEKGAPPPEVTPGPPGAPPPRPAPPPPPPKEPIVTPPPAAAPAPGVPPEAAITKPGAPRVVVDVKPTAEGGWSYEFKIPEPGARPAPPARVIPWMPLEKELPPAEIPPVEKAPPKVIKPRAAPVFKDPLYQAINLGGGIAPNADYPYKSLRQILPPTLIKKGGLAMDKMAQELSHEFPRITGDQDLYDTLSDLKRGRLTYKNMKTGDEFAAEPPDWWLEAEEEAAKAVAKAPEIEYIPTKVPPELLGAKERFNRVAFRDPETETIYRPKEDELVHAQMAERFRREGIDYEKFQSGFIDKEGRFIDQENYTAALNKREPLRIYEEKPPLPKEEFRLIPEEERIPKAEIEKPEEKRLFVETIERPKVEMPSAFKKEIQIFPDINTAREAIQEDIRNGWVIEFGQTPDRIKGWARGIEKRMPGSGKAVYIPLKRAPEFLKRPEIQYEITGEKPTLEIPIEEKAKFKPEDLPAIFKRMNITNPDIQGDLTVTLLENYKPEKGPIENYIRTILSKRYQKTGERKVKRILEQLPEEEIGIPEEKAVFPAKEKGPPERFAEEEENVRVRRVLSEIAETDEEFEILKGKILDEETFEEIGLRLGRKPQSIQRTYARLLDKLSKHPEIEKIKEARMKKLYAGVPITPEQISDLIKLVRPYFVSSKGVAKEIDEANDERIGNILAEKFIATLETKELDKFIKDNKENPALVEYIREILTGEILAQDTALPENIKELLIRMRKRSDDLSEILILHGALSKNLKAVFESNLGKHLTKFYKLYEYKERAAGRKIKKYWDPPKEVRDRFAASLRRRWPEDYGDFTEEEMDNYLDSLLKDENYIPRKSRRTKRIPTENYIHRIYLTPEWKEFAGEIVDPRYLYLKTITKKSVMAYNSKFLSAIADYYPDLWTKDEAQAKRMGWVKAHIPEDRAYGKLKDAWVSPALNDFIRHEIDPRISGIEEFLIKFFINPFKWTKTIGSIPTHARNFLGNTGLSMMMRDSIANPANLPYYVKAVDVFVNRNKSMKEEWTKLIREGVTETQFWGAEIPKFYEDILRLDPETWPEKIWEHTVKAGIARAGNLYNAEDAIYRIAAHYKNIDHFKMSPKESVEEINRGLTNYRKLPPVVEVLRRWPVFGPFISFRWNIAKIIVNQLGQSAKEITAAGGFGPPIKGKGGARWQSPWEPGQPPGPPSRVRVKDSKLFWKGFFRLLRVALFLGFPTLVSEISKHVSGIDEEEERKLNGLLANLPKYRKHGTFIYLKNKEGKIGLIDLTYIWPTGEWERAVRSLFSGDIDSSIDAINLFAHPVFDVWQILIGGREPSFGQKIPGGFINRITEIAKMLWIPASAPVPSLKGIVKGEIKAGALTPYQIKNIIDAYYQEAPPGEEPRKLSNEVIGFFTGIRTYDLDPEKIMKQAIRSKKAEVQELKAELTRWILKHQTASDWEIEDKRKEIEKRAAKIAKEINDLSVLFRELSKGGHIGKKTEKEKEK